MSSADLIAKSSIKLNLIFSMGNLSRGIGVNGKLPWRIPEDMKFFSKVTTHTSDPNKTNAVIMGRVTWFSIPKNFRPLPNRLNVIISNKLKDVKELEANEKANLTNILIFNSFDEAIGILLKDYSDKIESIYAIGGSQIYRKCFEYPNGFLYRIFLTRVYSDVECDTFIEPENFLDSFKKLSNSNDLNHLKFEFNSIITEPTSNLKYSFEVYEKQD